jgi:hypothetical protein
MSSQPGLTLEKFLMWDFDLVVDGDATANPSLQIAEAVGTIIAPRPRITSEQFAPVVALFEPYRFDVERRLQDFDNDDGSWRDYAGYAFDFIPREPYLEAHKLLECVKAAR